MLSALTLSCPPLFLKQAFHRLEQRVELAHICRVSENHGGATVRGVKLLLLSDAAGDNLHTVFVDQIRLPGGRQEGGRLPSGTGAD
jgi:hypothetical protein